MTQLAHTQLPSAYKTALKLEARMARHTVIDRVNSIIYYKGYAVGDLRADMSIDGDLINVISERTITEEHVLQMRRMMNQALVRNGWVINFSKTKNKVYIKRICNQQQEPLAQRVAIAVVI